MSACKSCGTRVLWAETINGKRMPLNPELDPDGNVAARRDERGLLMAHVLRVGETARPGEALHTSHFVTCPNAGQHRQRVSAGR